MTLHERLKYCRICENRKMNTAIGLICGLNNEKPTFESSCIDLVIDKAEADRLVKMERDANTEDEASGHLTPEKSIMKLGVLGGIIMIAVALAWFILGWINGYIYFYPPVLLIMGIFALIKGLVTGNISGEKSG